MHLDNDRYFTGAVTYSDLVTMMPFNNNIYKVTYKGSTIKKVLEHGFFTKTESSYLSYLVFSGKMKCERCNLLIFRFERRTFDIN